MSFRIVARCAALALVAVLLGSCGGSEKGTTAEAASATKPTLTRKAFIAKGNAICKRVNDRLNALAKPGPDATLSETADFVDRSADNIARGLRELEALPVPKGDEAKLEAIFRSNKTVVANAYGLAADFRAGADPAYLEQSLDKFRAEGDAANAAFRIYGLSVCAED